MHKSDILLLEGYSRTSIAAKLGVSRRTVYNYEHRIVFKDTKRQGRPKGSVKLGPFYKQIDAALEEDFTLNVEILFSRLVSSGYTGKISIVRDYVRMKRSELHNLAVWRFETLPGNRRRWTGCMRRYRL